MKIFIICACTLGIVVSLAQAASDPPASHATNSTLSITALQAKVTAAIEPAPRWDGPRSGPPGMHGKMIAVIGEDLRNGGVLGVGQGVNEAANALGWRVKVFDAGGTRSGRDDAANAALATHPDGVILIGADANEMQARLNPFAERGIPIVGWHVGSNVGAMSNGPVAVNISTDPLEVGQVTAAAAVVGSSPQAHCGVVIFTDPNFGIAQTKAHAMADLIRGSKDCTLLEMKEVSISKSPEEIPTIIRDLLARHGKRWTCALAINDIYFDYAVPELTKAGQTAAGIKLLSAGDGSASAFMRIQAGIFQTGTVAEPLNLHGWQLVDELNRLLAHQPLSGYVAPVHLVTQENVGFDAGPRLHYDPDNGYREIYRHIWKR